MSKVTAFFSMKTLKAIIPILLTLITIVLSFGLISIGYLMIGATAWGNIGTELSQEEERMLLWYGWFPCGLGIALLLGVLFYWIYRVVQNERKILQQERQAQQTTEPNTPLNGD